MKNRLTISFWASCALCSTLFLFIPLHIYFDNLQTFCFAAPFIFILLESLLISIITTGLLTILLLLFRSGFQSTISFVSVLSLLIWFKGNILVWNYGVLDGHIINWAKLNYRGFVEVPIYLLFIIMLLRKNSVIFKTAKTLSIILIIIQLTSIILFAKASATGLASPLSQNRDMGAEHKLTFSTDKNIILLIVDTFQSDLFLELLNDHSEYRKIFPGFTYFRNTTGGYPATDFVIPLILAGQFYDNSLCIKEFIRKASRSEHSLPHALTNLGFLVYVHPSIMYPQEDQAETATQKPRRFKDIANEHNNVCLDLARLYDAALFRISPHFLKKYVYNRGHWVLKNFFSNKLSGPRVIPPMISRENAPSDIKSLSRPLSATLFSKNLLNDDLARLIQDIREYSNLQNAPVFKFFYVNGLHSPIWHDEYFRFSLSPLDETREDLLKAAQAQLTLLKIFLDQLKALGIYDNSFIVIAADHGTPKVLIDTFQYGETKKNNVTGEFATIIASGNPLLLIKPFTEAGDLKISDSPASLADLNPTIFSALNLPEKMLSSSIFSLKPEDKRIRRFYHYPPYRQPAKADRLKFFTEYEISGLSWRAEAWKKK